MKLKTLQIEQKKQKNLLKSHLKNQKNLLKMKTAQAQKTQIQKKKAIHLAICLMSTLIRLASLTIHHRTNRAHLQAILTTKKIMKKLMKKKMITLAMENQETKTPMENPKMKSLILTTHQKMKTQTENQMETQKMETETQKLKMKNQAMSQKAETKEKTRNLNHQKSHLRIHLT